MRLIDADEVHNLVRNSKKYMWSSPISTDRKVTVSTDDIQFGVDKIPAIDAAEVVHGKWINKQGGFWETAECSICGAHSPTVGGGMYFCSHCGAKMDEVSGNE